MDNPFYFLPKNTFSLPINREVKGQDYISWGLDNQYPTYLKETLYANCGMHGTIVDIKKDNIVGFGLYSKLDKRNINNFIKKCNGRGESLNEVFSKCTLDYLLFGGMAIQVIFTKGSTVDNPKIAEIFYIDISKLRFNPDQDKIKYSKEWYTGRRKSKVIEYDLYNENDPTGNRIYYYRGEKCFNTYPNPEYLGAIMGIESVIKIDEWQLSRIDNGLFPSLHISVNNGDPGPEGRKAFEEAIKGKFQGSKNAGETFITYTRKDETPPTITPISLADLDNQFKTLQATVINNLFYTHRFPPILVGFQYAGALGPQTNYSQAFENFTNGYVESKRKTMLDVFDRILSVNFDQPDLSVIPLKPIGNVIDATAILASVMTVDELRKKAQAEGLIENWVLPEGAKLIGITNLKPAPNKTNDEDIPANNIPLPGNENIGDPTTKDLQ